MHHRAKLSDEQVAEMRGLRESRPDMWSYTALAEHFDSSESTVRDIVKYHTRNPTTKGYDKVRFQIAAEARQIILDLLNEYPEQNRPMDMVKAGVNRNRAESCITTMIKIGEIERTGKGLDARYKALVTTTMSADTMRAYVLAQQQAGRKLAPPPREEKSPPWYYKNEPDKEGHIRPTNQGGQGALRRVIGIQAAGMA